MRLIIAFLAAGLANLPAGSFAHAPKIGENGGLQTDAGSFHVELIAKENSVDVYLRDHANKVVASAGFKGTAILMIDGKPLRISGAGVEVGPTSHLLTALKRALRRDYSS
jgi:hypothetical protein